MVTISKILIANRGEIAVRIIRACKEMGIHTVIVYSEADRESLAVRMADKAVKIGPPPVQESYLFYQNILSAARSVGADAIHPGYGFLAENASFAMACRAINVKFIGPNPLAIRNMGNKSIAKGLMKAGKVPVVPGSDGVVESEAAALEVAEDVGYPVMIKASSGGGGRGLRVVGEKSAMKNAFASAATEASQAFGDASLYVEKYIENPKHLEIQILADQHGNVVHLFERDCSVQRKNQKLIEEAPSAILSEAIRNRMGRIALQAAQTVRYDSAGTVEFLFDLESKKFYFMEMNTRIQVEHPVSEEITGIDLIKKQILIAQGEKLGLEQEQIKINGHAIECRINAEDPARNFAATPGRLTTYIPPGGPGVRVDSGVYPGYTIPPYYDSMIAKLIVRGADRGEAVEKMKRSLAEFYIKGVSTTIPFHQEVFWHPVFLSGRYTTRFVDLFFD